MLIVMQHGASSDQVERVVDTIEELGYQARPMPGAQRTAVASWGTTVGSTRPACPRSRA